MNRGRCFLIGFATIMLFIWGISDLFAQKARTGPPNFVIILLDDIGYGDLGCYGNKKHQTPHIDKLAAEGLLFTDFHTNGCVCSPTRAALLTGQYQQRSGIESAIGFTKDKGMPLRKTTIAEPLREAGYAAGVFGKWHVGHVDHFGPNDQGFQNSYVSNNSPDYHTHVSRVGELDWYKNHNLYKESGYLTHLVTDHTLDFIKANQEKPFFAFISHVACHFPFQGPEDPPHRTLGKIWHDTKYGPLPKEEYPRAYKDMLEAVDNSVGQVLALLEKLGLRENTFIFLTSDNGAYSWVGSNGPFRGQKGDLYEGGHRVPAIVSWPGHIKGNRTTDQTSMTMDIMPTILQLAGVEKPDGLHFDGIDLTPLLLRNKKIGKRPLFWRFNNLNAKKEAYAVREGRWKYVRQDRQEFLFDLKKDPEESRNLVADKMRKTERLQRAVKEWEEDVTAREKSKN